MRIPSKIMNTGVEDPEPVAGMGQQTEQHKPAREVPDSHDPKGNYDAVVDIDDDEESQRPGEWTWGLHSLKKVLAAAKGAATSQVVDFLKKHLHGTKLIFVFGKTGAGKTTILKELTSMDLKVGDRLGSGTHHYEICPAVICGGQYLLVDTAGFGAADMDNIDNMEDIMGCLLALGPFVTVAGALFIYDCKEDRLTKDEAKTIRWLQCFCGPEFYQNITIITTKWDALTPKERRKARDRLKDLKADDSIAQILDPQGCYSGGHFYNHGIRDEEAGDWSHALDHEDEGPERAAQIKTIVHERYGHPATAKLQIRMELDRGRHLQDTEAAKALKADPADIKVRLKGNLAVVLGKDEPDPWPGTPLVFTADNEPRGQPGIPDGLPGSFWWWLNIAKEAAVFFWKFHKEIMTETNTKANAGRGLWGMLKDWWSGAPPEA